MTADICLVVLAAGRGSRMGGPKALLRWPDPTAVEPGPPLAWMHALNAGPAERCVVVVRPEVAAILTAMGAPNRPCTLVTSNEPEKLGPAGSLRAAARHLQHDPPDIVLVTPADCPPVQLDTRARLVKLLKASPEAKAVKPRFDGRGGHPVAIEWDVMARYLSDAFPLRDHLRNLGSRCLDHTVGDSGVRVDLDDANDFSAWQLGRGWPASRPAFASPPSFGGFAI